MTYRYTSEYISAISAAHLLGYAYSCNARRLAKRIDHECFAQQVGKCWVFSRKACLLVNELMRGHERKFVGFKNLRGVRATLTRKQRQGALVPIVDVKTPAARSTAPQVYTATFTALSDTVRKQEQQIAELQAQLAAREDKPRAWWRLW